MFEGRVLVDVAARGEALVLDEPLSFWGGLDATTGEVSDRRHPQAGMVVTGTILVMPHGKGSSSASSVLAEAIRLGTGPAAIVMRGLDEIVALGAVVAAELYGIVCPVLVVTAADYNRLSPGTTVQVEPGGRVTVGVSPPGR